MVRFPRGLAFACVALGTLVGGLAASLAMAQGPKATGAQDQRPGCSLGLASAPNFRDLGGYSTKEGFIVRKGLLFRSGQLSRLSAGDLKQIAALGLKRDYDLRTADERTRRPDEPPAGVKIVGLDVLADSDQVGSAELGRLMRNPKGTDAADVTAKAAAVYAKVYRELVTLPSAKKAYRQLFRELADPANLPAVFHCSTGKDRGGWAAAALLALLGVPEDVVMEDYLRSNDYVLPDLQKTLDAYAQAGGDRAALRAILGVKAEYLKAALAEVKSQHGSIEGYFTHALEIDAAGQQALRERFLSRSAKP